jgi:hypothetical protein
MIKFSNFTKKIFSIFNYKIEHVKSWYKRQENYLAEIEESDLNFLKKINEFTMCAPANHWAIIQSLQHIKKNNIEGDLVECGVYKGGNIILFDYLLEKYQLNKKIFAYDTFEGMPKPSEIDMDLKNNLASQTKKNYEKNNIIWCYASLDEVKNNIKKFNLQFENKFKFIKGDVLKTLIVKDNIPEKISLLRLDTDFYESTKIELEILFPRLVKNGILIIDDYGHWKGSKKAVDEYFNLKENFKWFHRIDYASRLLIKD